MARRAAPTNRSDEERLRHFVHVVERCVDRRAVQQGTIRASVKIRAGEGQGIEVESDHGDAEDVRSLLVEFRKLLADNDDASFYGICNVLYRRVVDEEMRECVRSNREAWQTIFRGQVSLVKGDRKIAGRALIDVWLNGVVFHSDPADAAFYGSLDPISLALFQQEVNSMVMEGLRVAHVQRNLINAVLARELLGEAAPED